MIPDFDENGLLPPGIHPATLEEVDQRLGRSTPERVELMQSLQWLIDMIRQDDVLRLIVNGSFVTAEPVPDDIDCVALGGPTFGHHGISIHEWRTPVPFVHLEVGDAIIFKEYVDGVFASDRLLRPKGMVEVLL